ncbi:Methyltransferase domain-containing protein [Alteribacillus persepolensis]|uniref:Methyltransferase domain-containing protein n=1 Tax=Alteribacillus persepolensis TaxID=568899 RepID=A0A1G8JZY0_9BACI|nr:class I SAM-dependent methyltransferase [Alteribacillus persepolensis]SDI36679.1 Methyltransferase domain-containing protein [Alteribacillus persepolensis]
MLKDTGERIIPENMKPDNGMLLEHIARYYFAMPYTHGRVLDIACGAGYGTKMVAKTRKKYISNIYGVDIDADVIRYANKMYYHPLLAFHTGDVLKPDLVKEIGTFDTVISFETLEHVPDDRQFLQRILSLVKPGGTLIVSTPFGKGRGQPCQSPFHYFQLTEAEFQQLFFDTPAIEHVQFFYQQGIAFETVKHPSIRYPMGIAVAAKAAAER